MEGFGRGYGSTSFHPPHPHTTPQRMLFRVSPRLPRRVSPEFHELNVRSLWFNRSLDVPSVCKMEFDIPDTPRFPVPERTVSGVRQRTTGGL